MHGTYLTLVVYTKTFIFADDGLFIGLTTRQLLKQLENEGDISSSQTKVFYEAVREFYVTAVEYSLKNLPLTDELLDNAQCFNFQTRETSMFSQVEFFIIRYMYACTIILV